MFPGLTLSLLLVGCGDKDLVFVTSTTAGLNFDSTTQQLNIGYDRTEGYLGPRFADGSVVPALAAFHGSASVGQQSVRDLYAAGKAAVTIANGGNDAKASDPPADNTEPPTPLGRVFVGTSTSAGIKVGFDGATAAHVNVGYRRSVLGVVSPGIVNRGGKSVLVYPSVVASVDAANAISSPDATESKVGQFLIVGEAADRAALNPALPITEGFRNSAAAAFASDHWMAVAEDEVKVGSKINDCYDRKITSTEIKDREKLRSKFWGDAASKKIYPDTQNQQDYLNYLEKILKYDPVKADTVFKNSFKLSTGEKIRLDSMYVFLKENCDQ